MAPLLHAQRQGVQASGPAIGLVEVTSIARGVVVADAMVKRAQVTLALVRPVSPGKHLSLCTGEVAEVQEAMAAALPVAGSALCDQLLLTQVHDELLRALSDQRHADHREGAAIGIIETFSAAAALLSADAACKAAAVTLIELRLRD